MSNNIYTQVDQPKSSIISLVDAEFQKSILGSGFNVDEMISLGYYPQVNYSTTRMPKQDFIELPAINEDDYADIISTSVDSQTNNEAIINVSVNNILGEEISSIQITDLDTEIISQTYEDGKSQVKLRVFNPQIYVSRYQIKSISSRRGMQKDGLICHWRLKTPVCLFLCVKILTPIPSACPCGQLTIFRVIVWQQSSSTEEVISMQLVVHYTVPWKRQ